MCDSCTVIKPCPLDEVTVGVAYDQLTGTPSYFLHSPTVRSEKIVTMRRWRWDAYEKAVRDMKLATYTMGLAFDPTYGEVHNAREGW